MLRADVIMVELACLLDGVFDDFLGPRGLRELAHGDHVGPGLDDLLDFEADLAQVNVEVFQDIGRHAGPLLDEAEEDVFGPDVFVVEALRLLVGELHHLAGPVGESFVHWPITLRHSGTVSCWKGWRPSGEPHAKSARFDWVCSLRHACKGILRWGEKQIKARAGTERAHAK